METAEQVRTSSIGEGMRGICIVSNGDWQWLADLKVALRRVYYVLGARCDDHGSDIDAEYTHWRARASTPT